MVSPHQWRRITLREISRRLWPCVSCTTSSGHLLFRRPSPSLFCESDLPVPVRTPVCRNGVHAESSAGWHKERKDAAAARRAFRWCRSSITPHNVQSWLRLRSPIGDPVTTTADNAEAESVEIDQGEAFETMPLHRMRTLHARWMPVLVAGRRIGAQLARVVDLSVFEHAAEQSLDHPSVELERCGHDRPEDLSEREKRTDAAKNGGESFRSSPRSDGQLSGEGCCGRC